MIDKIAKFLKEPQKTEEAMDRLSEYTYSRGGGLVWFVAYLAAFTAFIYKVAGWSFIPPPIELIIVVLLILIGYLLFKSLRKHLKLLESYLIRNQALIDNNKKELEDKHEIEIEKLNKAIQARENDRQKDIDDLNKHYQEIIKEKDTELKEKNTKLLSIHFAIWEAFGPLERAKENGHFRITESNNKDKESIDHEGLNKAWENVRKNIFDLRDLSS